MFQWLWSFLRWIGILQQKRAQVVIVGLDNAGKTTLLHTMQTHHFAQFEQTKSYTQEELEFGGIHMTCFDLGGHSVVRQSWSEYYLKADAVVFVIDASDNERISEAKEELSAIQEKVPRNVPILILGNKQDVVGCISRIDVQHLLHILGNADHQEPLNNMRFIFGKILFLREHQIIQADPRCGL